MNVSQWLEEKGGKQVHPLFQEQGVIGQNKYAGVFSEEFLPDLQGRKGIEVYKEMSDNDDMIGSILFAVEMLIRQVEWHCVPGGEATVDQEAARFVQSCLDDMEQSWQDTISEILSFLVYGWSFHEICYKRRMGKSNKKYLSSRYHDGLIGWRKLPIRSQDTLYRWEYNDRDELTGMSQMAPPDYLIRTIPLEKALHFVTRSRKNHPEGRSILRNCYVDYYYKRRFRQIEGIGIERDLAGLPVIQPPEGVNIWDSSDRDMMKALSYAENLVRTIRRDEKEGVVLPYGWTLSLLNGGSRRQFEIGNVIERMDNRMAMTCMADFVLLGHQQTGSFALSSDKTRLFAVAIGTYLDIICEVFNTQGIPRLIELNSKHFQGFSNYPKLLHGDIEKPNLLELASYLEKISNIGLLTPDHEIERQLRQLADLPKMTQAERESPEEKKRKKSSIFPKKGSC